MSKPQGSTTITSGSARTSASQRIPGECFPASPNRLTPPAFSTSSGIQLPAAIRGSIHSIEATEGRPARPPARSAIAAIRSWSDSTSAAPRSGTPRASATRAMSVHRSASPVGSSETIRGRASSQSETACSTSLKVTAHTSHWDWVTMTSGLKALSLKASTR